jgi:hypothetical protein
VETIGQDGNGYYSAKCKTAGEVCKPSLEYSPHIILQFCKGFQYHDVFVYMSMCTLCDSSNRLCVFYC